MKKISHSRNSLYSLTSWVLPIALAFVATPFILGRLGVEEYGLYVLVNGFIAYSFSFNIGRAVVKYVSEFDARGEKEKISEIIAATFYFGLGLGAICSSILVGLSGWLVADVLKIAPEQQAETVTAFYLAAVCVWLMIINQIFSGVLQALHRFDIYSLITVLANILLITGNILLVWAGYQFVSLVAWNTITIIFSGALFFALAKKKLPELNLKLNFSREIFWVSVKYGLSVTGYQILINLLLIFERSVITRYRGADDLTHYVVPMNIAIYIHAFVSSLTINFVPLTSGLFAADKKKELERLYRRINKVVIAVIIYLCVALGIGGQSFLTNWISADFAEISADVFLYQLATFGLLAWLVISWQFIEGLGIPYYNTINSFVWVIVAVPLMLMLVKTDGIRGVAIARLLSVAVIPISILLNERKLFDRIQWRFWRDSLALLGLSAIVAGAAEYFWLSSFPVNWFNLIVGVGLCGMIFSAMLYFTFYFTDEEKVWLQGFFKRVFAS